MSFFGDRKSYVLRSFRALAGGQGTEPIAVVSRNKPQSTLRSNEVWIEYTGFAPLLTELAAHKVRFVLLFDILQTVPKEDLAEVVAGLADLPYIFYVVVSLAYSSEFLQDGTNAYKTVEPAQWWALLFRSKFNEAVQVKPFSEYDAAIWTPGVPPRAARPLYRSWLRLAVAREYDRLAGRAALLARKFRGGIATQLEILEELEGKSVSVVGNARSLSATLVGERIDGNDLVIRFNRAPMFSRQSSGHRTDWLATSIALDRAFLDGIGTQKLLWMSRRRDKINHATATAPNLYLHPIADVSLVAARAGVERPSTGLMVIDILERSACKSVELFGFDFYKSLSLSGHQVKATAPHAFDSEETYITNLITRDPRFSLCS